MTNDESPKPEFSVVHNPAPEPKSVPVPKKQNKGAAISPPGQVEEDGQITTNSRVSVQLNQNWPLGLDQFPTHLKGWR